MRPIAIAILLSATFLTGCTKQQAHEPAHRLRSAAVQVEAHAQSALDSATARLVPEKKAEGWQKPSAATVAKAHRRRR
jgi:hypothetical protein